LYGIYEAIDELVHAWVGYRKIRMDGAGYTKIWMHGAGYMKIWMHGVGYTRIWMHWWDIQRYGCMGGIYEDMDAWGRMRVFGVGYMQLWVNGEEYDSVYGLYIHIGKIIIRKIKLLLPFYSRSSFDNIIVREAFLEYS